MDISKVEQVSSSGFYDQPQSLEKIEEDQECKVWLVGK